jgi:hypothetical protein
MYAKLKTNLIGLAAALSFVVVGFSLGEAPGANPSAPVTGPMLVQVDASPALAVQESTRTTARRGALKRHLAMPYVSFAALLPRQEG